MVTLTVGEKANQCLWMRKSQTGSSDQIVLDRLHQLGMTSKMNKGKIFLMMTLRFLQKDEVITQEHCSIYDSLGEKHFKEEVMPTAAEEENCPFPPWRPPTWGMVPGDTVGLVASSGGGGGNNGVGNNGGDKPVEPEPVDDTDDDTDDDDGELFDLFA